MKSAAFSAPRIRAAINTSTKPDNAAKKVAKLRVFMWAPSR